MFFDRHHGRVRAFPHQEGNYATHVHIAGAPSVSGSPCACVFIQSLVRAVCTSSSCSRHSEHA